MGAAVAAELDLERAVQVVTDAATELSGAQFGAFFYNVVDERGGRYMLYTLSGVPREAFSRFPMPRNTALFGATFRGSGIVRSRRRHQDSALRQERPHYGMPKGHLPVRSYLAVPVISRSGEVLGGLFFGHREARRVHRTRRALCARHRDAGRDRDRQRAALPGGADRDRRAQTHRGRAA